MSGRVVGSVNLGNVNVWRVNVPMFSVLDVLIGISVFVLVVEDVIVNDGLVTHSRL